MAGEPGGTKMCQANAVHPETSELSMKLWGFAAVGQDFLNICSYSS